MNPLVLLAQETDVSKLDAGYEAMQFVFWVFGLAAALFCLWMLIDAIRKEPTPAKKFGWALIILLLPLAGALIYFFARKATLIRPAT